MGQDAGTMEESNRRKKMMWVALIVLAALFVPVALVATGGLQMWRESRAAREARAEHAEALRAALERAADVVLPVPTLLQESMELDVPMADFETELQRVVRLAHGVGGSVASWNDGEVVRIVANVPASAEDIFRQAVQRGVYDLRAEGETARMTVVQIVMRPKE